VKKTILVICALFAAHTQALEIKNDLLSELQKNHKEARQLIKANKEQEKKQETEERKNIAPMTKTEAGVIVVGITSLCIAVGCTGNYLFKGNTKAGETAIISLCVGLASCLSTYCERKGDKQSREFARALDDLNVKTLFTWAGLI
jgi:Flp pilus assembly protein TadB